MWWKYSFIVKNDLLCSAVVRDCKRRFNTRQPDLKESIDESQYACKGKYKNYATQDTRNPFAPYVFFIKHGITSRCRLSEIGLDIWRMCRETRPSLLNITISLFSVGIPMVDIDNFTTTLYCKDDSLIWNWGSGVSTRKEWSNALIRYNGCLAGRPREASKSREWML